MARRKPYIFGSKAGSGSYSFRGGGLEPLDLTPPKLTLSQALQIQSAKKKGHSESFWDRIKHGGGTVLHPVEWTFDKILRPSYGLAEAIASEHRAQNKGAGFLGQLEAGAHGFARGFTGREKHGFGAALPFTHDTPEHHTFLKNHKVLRGAIGLGADVVFDPLTYISGGSTILARSGEHAAAIAAGRRTIEDATRRGFEHDPAKALSLARKDAAVLRKAGDDYKFRSALADEQARHFTLDMAGTPATKKDLTSLSMLRDAAHAEEKRVEKFLPHYKLGGKQITPTSIGGKSARAFEATKVGRASAKTITTGRQLVPALPKLDRIVARGGIGGRAAQRFRERFVREAGYTPETHSMAMVQKHTGEWLAKDQLEFARNRLEGLSKGLGDKRQREILHLFETPLKAGDKRWKAVVSKGGKYELNPKYVTHLIEKGKLQPHEADFAEGFQQVMEQLYHNDRAFGVDVAHFSRNGRMYVPHMADFTQGNVLNDAMRKLTTKAGFERARSHRQFSLHTLYDKMQAEGKLPEGVIGDPYEVLVGRIRASARRQAELGMLHSMSKVGGVPTRLVDSAKLEKNIAHQGELQDLLAAMEKGHEADHQKLAAAVRKIKFGRNAKLKAANLARANKRLAKAKAAHEIEIKQFNAKLKDLQKAERQLRKGKANRAYRSDMVTTSLKDEHGHPVAFDRELGTAVERVHKVVTGDDQAIKAFDQGWRRWVAKWKLLVTSINPGYRVRNTSSDAWSMYVSGASAYDMGRYSLRAGQVMRAAKKGDPKALNIVEEAYRHGILSGLYAGDIQTVRDYLKYSGSKRALIKKARFDKLFVKLAQDMNRNAENFGRLAHLLWQTEGEGRSIADAAFRVKRAHFDYEDLTPFEQKKMKAVMPFYTWTRKNIPFQVKALIERPGKYAALPKAAMESENASGGDTGTLVPSYIPDAFGFQIPFGKHNYLLPQIGAADLQALDSRGQAIQRLTGLVNPAFKVPAELATNKNLFTGGDIASSAHSRSPITPFAASLLSLLPGSNVGATSRIGPGGERLTGPGANPKLVYALGNLGPLAGLLLTKSGGIKSKSTPINPLWSYAAGLSIQHVDPEQQQMFAELAASDDAKKLLSVLRDEGIVPPAKHRKTGKSKYMSKRLQQELGRR